MTLSVLIPVYNYDCRQLVKDLLQQLPADGEIVVLDDDSTQEETRRVNHELATYRGVRYDVSPTNLGRAKARNTLADMAQGRWLLFMDCDAAVPDADFIPRYLRHIEEAEANPHPNIFDVIVGGTRVPTSYPSADVRLRYKYEKDYWGRQTVATRQRSAYTSFTTFNFLIRAELFQSIRFCEDIHTYGHEDTLLGDALGKRGARMLHIENPLIHCGLDTNADFLAKTRSAIENVIAFPDTPSKLRQWQKRLQNAHLECMARQTLGVMMPWMERHLLGANPSLQVFRAYKLGYYLQRVKRSEGSSPK